ncbi:MAG: hypothetical protein ACPGYT_12970, partial [Nitrospirales bacterium]
MGIRISERAEVFHVPYGALNSDGTPENGYIDIKANPAWIPVLSSCVGWPETQNLLQILNAPSSVLISFAADQAYVDTEPSQPLAPLTSFVTVGFADSTRNTKSSIVMLAEALNQQFDFGLQNICNARQQSLNLDIVLELQPTLFHDSQVKGWSLTVLLAAYGNDRAQVREMWGVCLEMMGTVFGKYR